MPVVSGAGSHVGLGTEPPAPRPALRPVPSQRSSVSTLHVRFSPLTAFLALTHAGVQTGAPGMASPKCLDQARSPGVSWCLLGPTGLSLSGLSFLICQISPSQSQAYGVLRRPNRMVCVRHPANPHPGHWLVVSTVVAKFSPTQRWRPEPRGI